MLQPSIFIYGALPHGSHGVLPFSKFNRRGGFVKESFNSSGLTLLKGVVYSDPLNLSGKKEHDHVAA